MKIRFTNPFLLSVGSALILGAILFSGGFLTYFFGGVCFGLIFRNMYETHNQ